MPRRHESRTLAKKLLEGDDIRAELESQGTVAMAHIWASLAEETPLACKDVESVVRVAENASLSRRVARLKPQGGHQGLVDGDNSGLFLIENNGRSYDTSYRPDNTDVDYAAPRRGIRRGVSTLGKCGVSVNRTGLIDGYSGRAGGIGVPATELQRREVFRLPEAT